LVGEREAPHEDRAGGRWAVGISGRLVGERPAPQLARPDGRLGEPVSPARLDHGRLPERGEREAAPVGLLEAEEAIAGAAGSEHDGRQVELRGHRDGHGGHGRRALSPRQRCCPLRSLAQQARAVETEREGAG
jgi:hypothetical protein